MALKRTVKSCGPVVQYEEPPKYQCDRKAKGLSGSAQAPFRPLPSRWIRPGRYGRCLSILGGFGRPPLLAAPLVWKVLLPVPHLVLVPDPLIRADEMAV